MTKREMPKVTLNSGISLEISTIRRAEFYGPHAFDHVGCAYGGAEMRRVPFLVIETDDSVARTDGPAAWPDMELLLSHGVPVRTVGVWARKTEKST